MLTLLLICAFNVRCKLSVSVHKELSFAVCSIEITITRYMILSHVVIIAVYCSPSIKMVQLCSALTELLNTFSSQMCIFIGNFSVNWFNDIQKNSSS